MLVMPEIPGGCWELTGQYERDRVSVVVWVPEQSRDFAGTFVLLVIIWLSAGAALMVRRRT
jgi:hypothetical protein